MGLVQRPSHCGRQCLDGERLLDHTHPVLQSVPVEYDIFTVSRREEDPDLRSATTHFLRHLVSLHARKHDIGEKKFDRLAFLFDQV